MTSTIDTTRYWRPIAVEGFGELIPQADITALEAAHIAILLTVCSHSAADPAGFIMKHGLERHFSGLQP